MRLVPPPRDLRAETRDAIRRFRDSVDLEDEPTQPEIHFHLGDELARRREAAAIRTPPPSEPPLRKSVGKLVAKTTAAVVAIGALAEVIRQLLQTIH